MTRLREASVPESLGRGGQGGKGNAAARGRKARRRDRTPRIRRNPLKKYQRRKPLPIWTKLVAAACQMARMRKAVTNLNDSLASGIPNGRDGKCFWRLGRVWA